PPRDPPARGAPRALRRARRRGRGARPGVCRERPVLPVRRLWPYPLSLGRRGRAVARRGAAAGAAARRRRDLPLAGRRRPLPGTRRPPAGVPRLLLRPPVPGARPSPQRGLHRPAQAPGRRAGAPLGLRAAAPAPPPRRRRRTVPPAAARGGLKWFL